MSALILSGCAGGSSAAPNQVGLEAGEQRKADSSDGVGTLPPITLSDDRIDPQNSPLVPSALFLAGQRAFRGWDADSNERMVIQRERMDAGGVQRWRSQRFVASSAPDVAAPAQEEELFVIAADGSLTLAERIDRTENVEVVFDPPLFVLPAQLQRGTAGTMNQSLQMRVYAIGDRSRPKHQGPVQCEVRYAGDQTITTPHGVFVARRIESRFTADLSPARVTNTSSQWFVDDVGLIAEKTNERTSLLGLPIRNNSSMWVVDEAVEARTR